MFGKHDDRDFAGAEVLLIAQVLVRSNKHVKTGGFGGVKQFAVSQAVSLFLRGGGYGVAF